MIVEIARQSLDITEYSTGGAKRKIDLLFAQPRLSPSSDRCRHLVQLFARDDFGKHQKLRHLPNNY